jgi:hypothetical protein
VECELEIGPIKNAIIRSKWCKWQTEYEAKNINTQTPFIHRAYDDLKLVTPAIYNTVCWATLEHRRRMHWGEMKGYWRIVHLRPVSYGENAGIN